MARLDPNAPDYRPSTLGHPVEYYCYSHPPPLSINPSPPFQLYFDYTDQSKTSSFCSFNYPFFPQSNQCFWYYVPPSTLYTGYFIRTKDVEAGVLLQRPFAPSLQLPPCRAGDMQEEDQNRSSVFLEEQDVEKEGHHQVCDAEVVEQPVSNGGEACETWGNLRHPYWKPKGLRDADGVVRKRMWVPKFRGMKKTRTLKPLQAAFEFNDHQDSTVSEEIRTTVMIKNLPNKLSKEMLLKLLDEHCSMENKLQIGEQAERVEETVLSEFDFFYLPMDFDSGSNLGYAFVNFTSAAAAKRLHRAYHKKGWDDLLGSRKICEVSYARIQGLDALLKHFRNSVFVCNNEDYLPVYFTPSRDGLRGTDQHYVGKRISSGKSRRA